jgi:hypothetical protein
MSFDLAIAQAHDRALAELLLDLGERGGKRLCFSALTPAPAFLSSMVVLQSMVYK